MSTDPDTVGVVIPTYERVSATVRAVESVLAQTITPASVVVVDDGSGAETRAALAAALRQLPVSFVEAERTAHAGRTRNRGLQELSTEWIAFLDSDDTWHPDKLERQLDLARTAGCDAVCTNARRLVGGRPVGNVIDSFPADGRLRLADLVRLNRIVTSTVLIRRTRLEAAGGLATSYLVRVGEDYATWLRVASAIDWHALDEPLADYSDDPAASIRGVEGSSSLRHAGQHGAWLDFVMWRRQCGSRLTLAEVTIERLLPGALIADTARGSLASTARRIARPR